MADMLLNTQREKSKREAKLKVETKWDTYNPTTEQRNNLNQWVSYWFNGNYIHYLTFMNNANWFDMPAQMNTSPQEYEKTGKFKTAKKPKKNWFRRNK